MSNYRILGVYNNEDKLLSSIHKIQESGITIHDVITPYPIHEVIEALKLKTRLPVVAFISAIFALFGTGGFLYWTSVVNYPLVFGGKPQNTLSFIIVIFVMLINVTAVVTILSFFIRDRKGPGAVPYLDYKGISDDRYVIVVDGKINTNEQVVSDLLKREGAVEVAQIGVPETKANH
jgi:hypothetical protein